MRQMMEGVVLHGTGQTAILNGYTSAGKTGTAQKIDPVTHRYSATKLIASFVGFAPVNDPAVTILVVLDSPAGAHQGGQVAGPVFTQVAEKVLAYLNVRRDAEVMSSQRLKLRAAAQSANSDDSSPDRLGESGELLAMIDQADEPPHKVDKTVQPRLLPVQEALAEPSPDSPDPTGAGNTTKGSVVVEDTDSVVAPSFIGKSVRAAAETAEQAGLEIKAIGTGIAQQQAPAAGTRVPEGGVVTILFAR
jgi:membrane peptidoglycan carboxypeptidase